MDQVHVIRSQVLREGRSQRSVAREHGVSRNTVRKYLDQSEPRRVESKPRRRWVTERMAPRLEELLSRWSRRTTAKQRLTATRLHRQLLEDGYEVGITTVRSYVREWKRQRQETFIPLVSHYLFEPCFARPGEGHDKGSVEARGKGIRLAHMSPVPQGRTLEQIAGDVLASVDAAHSERARWEEELGALRELPPHGFEARKLEIVRASR